MVHFIDTDVADALAHALLTDYFADRTRSFPVTQGGYSTTFPDRAAFTPPAGVFLVVVPDGPDDNAVAGDNADSADNVDAGDNAVGCGGIRRIDAGAVGGARYEVKHLWLKPHARGSGAGRALLNELEARARAFGATELVLDTNVSLVAAAGLYRSSGFQQIARYNDNSNATTWLGKPL